ncbi:7-dehydrocholesterol reductase [Deltaproteobacteria bacterium]|nr:7-dehydrocholesterol reductase [Deltaproteobacteria bacterium]
MTSKLLRTTLGPLALMLSTPLIGLGVWVATVKYGGSILAVAADWRGAVDAVPRPSAAALGIIAAWFVFQYALLRLLPGPAFLGPVTPAGEQPRYIQNGVAAWWVTHATLIGAWAAGAPIGHLYDHFGPILATLTPAAFVVCMGLYWKGLHHPSSRDVVHTGNVVFDFFQGLELHPRLAGVQLKQLINCRVSMMGWSAITICFAAKQVEASGSLSPAMAVSVGLQVAYLYKFFVWEGGYFGSLDIMHDRFGYYICWGVLAWVPAVYALVALFLVEHAPVLSLWQAGGIAALGLASLAVNYDADRQRLRFRASGGQTTIWGKPAEALRAPWTAADGETRENLLLLSGWWGVARHFHYVPELLLAAAWTLAAGFACALPWFYLFFLTILLVDRAGRDDRRCAEKYGPAWDAYRARVPWKILPGVF